VRFAGALVTLVAALATLTIGTATCALVVRRTFPEIVRLEPSGFVVKRPDGIARLCTWRD